MDSQKAHPWSISNLKDEVQAEQSIIFMESQFSNGSTEYLMH